MRHNGRARGDASPCCGKSWEMFVTQRVVLCLQGIDEMHDTNKWTQGKSQFVEVGWGHLLSRYCRRAGAYAIADQQRRRWVLKWSEGWFGGGAASSKPPPRSTAKRKAFLTGPN